MSAPGPAAKVSNVPMILAALALVLAIVALGWTAIQPSAAPRVPVVREFVLVMGEGEILAGYNTTGGYVVPIDSPQADEEMVVGEFHRWEPGVLMAYVGDTIRLTVKNPRSNDHSFSLQAEPDAFSGTTSTGEILGRTNSGSPTGTEQVIELKALKPGVYKFICNTPHDHLNNKCDEDHPRMVGYIVVLA